MKKSIIITLLFFSNVIAFAAEPKTNLDKLSENERTEYLLEVTKDIIMKYAPGWYRDVGGYKIERREYSDKGSIERNGEISYRVIRYCDADKEVFEWGYSTQVYVNERTGEATSIMFGDGGGFGDLDNPEYDDDPIFKEFVEGESSKRK